MSEVYAVLQNMQPKILLQMTVNSTCSFFIALWTDSQTFFSPSSLSLFLITPLFPPSLNLQGDFGKWIKPQTLSLLLLSSMLDYRDLISVKQSVKVGFNIHWNKCESWKKKYLTTSFLFVINITMMTNHKSPAGKVANKYAKKIF